MRPSARREPDHRKVPLGCQAAAVAAYSHDTAVLAAGMAVSYTPALRRCTEAKKRWKQHGCQLMLRLHIAGVSSIGALDFRLDEWRVDVAVTGSQKALSLPTGLAVMAASPKVSGCRGSRVHGHWMAHVSNPRGACSHTRI